jgi:dipeptidyl aminopeptidase/acylaminoacyl peptidase
MASTVHSIDKEVTCPEERGQAVGGVRLDWAMALLLSWWVGGLYLDGWAHRHGKVDQSFFTPWHAAFYSGFLAVVCLLLVTMYQNHRSGYRRWQALPAGYEVSVLGMLIFAIGGVGDLIWHTFFGIEASTEALLSPTHLLLAGGAILILSGPLRAMWRRPAPTPDLVSLLPMLLSLAFMLSTFTFMTQFAHPLIDTWAAKQPGSAETISQLYVMNADGTFQVDLMNADGSAQTRLTDTGGNLYPAWVPDGRKIAFTGIRDGDWQVYVMNADGSTQTRLTDSKDGNYFPHWAPDGSKILFTSVRDGQNQLYVMNADGSGQTRLTDNTADDRFGRWSPDGNKIAFASRREGNFDVYVMNADGSGPTNLTKNPGMESGGLQSWSPDQYLRQNTSGTNEAFVVPLGQARTQRRNHKSHDCYSTILAVPPA